jgi:mono/diheme cytochrome c family protein
MPCRLFFVCFVVCMMPSAALAQSTEADREKLFEFFETKVRPVLAENCFSCHGATKPKGGIRLDRKEFIFKQRDEPLIVPGQPEKSLLVRAIRHETDYKMPPAPKMKLNAQTIDDIAAWIKLGAAWPDEKAVTTAPDPRKHWAFQPVTKPAIPTVKEKNWNINPIDAFIYAKLQSKGLAPNSPADARTLLRRLKFDLVGLPTTFDEAEAFAREWTTGDSVLEKQVERYLASPQYGERWARHWLDIARYADTKGYVFQEERKYAYAYTYRDYVVKALNEDLPYDQFLMQQLAADRLVAKGQAPASAQAAMGYLTLGRRFLNNIHDITDDRIDVVTRGMLGLTVACARCHDHKYDPISAKDYYGLYGVFMSSIEPKDLPLLGEPEQTKGYAAFQKQLGELEKAVKEFQTKNKKELDEKNRKFRDQLRALEKKVDAFKANSPSAPPRAMVMIDRPNPGDSRVLLRGSPGNPGPVAPRQFLTILANDKPMPLNDGSGRLDLARAIADKKNPLTARVFVNRVWQHYFGIGLVPTASDFGIRTDPPSHPELLDYLAWRFMEDGWSIKKLHRLIVTSRTYQLSSADHAKAREIDADNRWLARANRRRLDFEAQRDSWLAAAGTLDLKMGGPGVEITKAPYSNRRTIYGFIDRQNLPGMFRTFDLASPDSTTAQRYQTTVPQQALFMLNHPFVQEQTRALLKRAEFKAIEDEAGKIEVLHRIIYARQADADEVRIGQQFIEAAGRMAGPTTGMTPWERYTQALLLANEFAFVD